MTFIILFISLIIFTFPESHFHMGKPKFWRNPRLNANLLSRKLRTPRRQINFLQRASIIPISLDCPKCGFTITDVNVNLRQWKCSKCTAGTSIYNDTFLSESRISPRKMLMLGIRYNFLSDSNWLHIISAYYFSQHTRMTQERIQHEIGTSEDESDEDEEDDDPLLGEYDKGSKPPSLLSRTTIRL